MTRVVGKQLKIVREHSRDTLRHLLEFHTAWLVNRYLNQEIGQYRRESLEDELHNDYPLRGVGVRATRSNLSPTRRSSTEFLIDEVLLAPEDAVGEVSRFPIDAASITYAFAILEMHGNELAALMGGVLNGHDWHRAVSPNFNLRGKSQVTAGKAQLAQALGIPNSRVSLRLMKRLAAVKALRNRIVHEAHINADFPAALAEIIAVTCELHFACVPSDVEVVVYPWTDYEGAFHPGSEHGVHFRRA